MNILLRSVGAKTIVSVIDGLPELGSFTEPTLSILQAAFDVGDYEVIPDPDPVVETPPPDWDKFYDQLIVSQSYLFLYVNTISHPGISGAMAVMGFAIKDGEKEPTSFDRLAAFQASINGVLLAVSEVGLMLTNDMLAEVRQLLDDNGFNAIQL